MASQGKRLRSNKPTAFRKKEEKKKKKKKKEEEEEEEREREEIGPRRGLFGSFLTFSLRSCLSH